jgi:predicted secreted protein
MKLGPLIKFIILFGSITSFCASNKHISPHIELTEKNHDQKINLSKNNELIIKLKTNPSTGYSWQIISSGAPITQWVESWVEQEKEQIQDEHIPPVVGKSMWYHARFKPTGQKGHGLIKMVYLQPWRAISPKDQTFEIKIFNHSTVATPKKNY